MTRSTVLGVLTTGAALIALPTASAAAAVTGVVSKKCYSHIPAGDSEPVVVSLSGGTPNAGFVLAATVPGKGTGSAGSTSGTFDATGSAVATIRSVSLPGGGITPSKGRRIDLSVKDFGAAPDGLETRLGSTLVTNLTMAVDSGPRSAKAKRLVSVSGTPFANKALSAFITKANSTRVLKRIPLGRANACGYADALAIVAPPSRAPGSYRLYVNAGTTLRKSKALYYTFSITRRF